MTVAQAVSFAAMRSASLAVEVRHLLKKPDVLEQRRTVRHLLRCSGCRRRVAEFCAELINPYVLSVVLRLLS
jgi:hypothetical protein